MIAGASGRQRDRTAEDTVEKLVIAVVGASGSRYWQRRCVTELNALPNVHAELVGSPPRWSAAGTGWGKRLRRILQPKPQQSRAAESPGRLRKLHALAPDIIVLFDRSISIESAVAIARQGVWSFDICNRRNLPVSASALFRLSGATPLVEVCLTAEGESYEGRVVLYEGRFRITCPGLRRSIRIALREMAEWPARACDRPAAPRCLTDNEEMRRQPKSLAMAALVWAVRLARKALARPWRTEEWGIGVIRRPIHTLLEETNTVQIHWLPLRGCGSFAADPFALAQERDLHLFFERFDFSAGRGVIAHAAINPNTLQATPPRDVLRLPVHASYPYLLRYQGSVYCIPETAQAGEVALYKAIAFPHTWRKVAVLLSDVVLRDPTLFEHDGRWWLAGLGGAGAMNLMLWYADTLDGEWRPHARNPVKTDPRSVRPAGTPFCHAGELYRPAQDCSSGYGRRIVLCRVIQLSPTAFEEKIARIIEPQAGSYYRDGMHTVTAAGGYTLVDGLRITHSLAAIRKRFSRARQTQL